MVEFNSEIAAQLYELGLPLSSILVYADQKGVPSGLYSIFSDSLKFQWALEQADPPDGHPRFFTLPDLGGLPGLVRRIGELAATD